MNALTSSHRFHFLSLRRTTLRNWRMRCLHALQVLQCWSLKQEMRPWPSGDEGWRSSEVLFWTNQTLGKTRGNHEKPDEKTKSTKPWRWSLSKFSLSHLALLPGRFAFSRSRTPQQRWWLQRRAVRPQRFTGRTQGKDGENIWKTWERLGKRCQVVQNIAWRFCAEDVSPVWGVWGTATACFRGWSFMIYVGAFSGGAVGVAAGVTLC